MHLLHPQSLADDDVPQDLLSSNHHPAALTCKILPISKIHPAESLENSLSELENAKAINLFNNATTADFIHMGETGAAILLVFYALAVIL